MVREAHERVLIGGGVGAARGWGDFDLCRSHQGIILNRLLHATGEIDLFDLVPLVLREGDVACACGQREGAHSAGRVVAERVAFAIGIGAGFEASVLRRSFEIGSV